MSALSALIVAALKDPDVVSALREALAPVSHDEVIPLVRVAAEMGTTPRALRETNGHKDPTKRLAIEGPRNARVVRRSELDRYLSATAPRPALAKAKATDAANTNTDDEHAADLAAFNSSAAKAGRR